MSNYFPPEFKACHDRISEVYDAFVVVAGHKDLGGDMFIVKPLSSWGWCFRVAIIPNGGPVSDIRGISISCPPDRMGNRGIKYGADEVFPTTFETAIVGQTGEIIYPTDLIKEYDDVLSFSIKGSDFSELIDEVFRVCDIALAPRSIPLPIPKPSKPLTWAQIASKKASPRSSV